MRIYRRYLLCLMAAALSLASAAAGYAGQWQQGKGRDSKKWWYNNLDGSYPKREWVWIDGDSDGIAECYYFDADGWLVTSSSVSGSRVDGSGAWVDSSGAVQTRSVSEGNVQTNGANENSTGVIDLGSDLELGTEWEAEDPETGFSKGDAGKEAVEISVDLSSLRSFRSAAEKADGISEAESYGGPGSGGTAVISVTTAPGVTPGTAPGAGSSVRRSAEAFGGVVGSSSDSMPRTAATELVNYARSFIGRLRYATAGESLETGADCSGFTQQVFRHFGISIPRDSRSQYAAAEKISVEDLRAGDLIFYGSSPSTIYHVGIYSGDGTLVHSTHSGDYVREHDAFYAKPYGYGRFAN